MRSKPMLLRRPLIDLVLPLAFTSLAYVTALVAARTGRTDVLGLCLVLFAGGVLWLREVVLFLPHEAEDRDP